MSSGYSPVWRRVLHKIPFLFRKCPGHNYHWFWDKLCHCEMDTYIGGWGHCGPVWVHRKGEWQFYMKPTSKEAMNNTSYCDYYRI